MYILQNFLREQFVYPLICGHLGCFHILAIVNTAMNRAIQISVLIPAFNSFGHILRSGIAGSNANSVLNFLRN